MTRDAILQVDSLSIEFPQVSAEANKVVKEVSFSIERGDMLGIVGESGSGKTMLALSILGLLPGNGHASAGRILLNDQDLLQLSEDRFRRIRGRDVSIVFQDPLASLNPVRPVGSLLIRSVMMHQGCSKEHATHRVIEMLGAVGIPNPQMRIFAYPHQLSGGQRQRIMVALAAINNPSLIIADEPTTALDATVQVQILELLKSMASNCASLLITHDLSISARVCERVVVMRNGRIIESGDTHKVLSSPQHQYTKALVDAVPSFNSNRFDGQRSSRARIRRPILEVRDVDVTYAQSGRAFKAVNGASLRVNQNETVGIVGESGSGKSTLAKAIMQMLPLSKGQIVFDGNELARAGNKERHEAKRRIQYMFQDPYNSLDPRWTIENIIAEPMRVHNIGNADVIRQRVVTLIDQVELPAESIDRYPAEFSGGQRQRIALARSLAVNPDLLIADEPVSSLDVTIQHKIACLLKALQKKLGLALILIAHDLPLIYQLADRVVVVYLGQIVEQGPAEKVLKQPRHPYTVSLVSASKLESYSAVAKGLHAVGEPASPWDPPAGCRFHPRCPVAAPQCAQCEPETQVLEDGVQVRCHFPSTYSSD